MALDECHRGVEKDPAEQVGDLTQAAAVGRRQAAVLLRQGVAVRRFAVGIADAVPEGERLAGFDQEPVQLPGGQLEIVDLVFLVDHGKARLCVIHRAAGGKKADGQALCRLLGAIAAAIAAHGPIKAEYPLPLAQRQQPGKTLRKSFSCHHNMQLLAKNTRKKPRAGMLKLYQREVNFAFVFSAAMLMIALRKSYVFLTSLRQGDDKCHRFVGAAGGDTAAVGLDNLLGDG